MTRRLGERRPARRVALLLGLVVVAAPVGPARAHAFLQLSSPSDGAVLDEAPTELQLLFSESVELAATRIDVVDADGHHFRPTGMRISPPTAAGGREDPASLLASLPSLPRNAYRVSWETLSSDDLHRTSGILVFGVGRPVTAAAPAEPAPHPDEATLRWAMFVCLALALGGGFGARLFRLQGGPAAGAGARSCLRWSGVGSLGGAVFAAALLLDQLATSGWAGGRLLVGGYGQHWLLREAGFVLLLVAALGQRRRRQRRWVGLGAVGAAVVCVGSALLGHASAVSGATTRVAADAAHLAAAGVWIGTLLVLALVAVPVLRTESAAGTGRAVLRSFGLPAAACVGIMVVTGVYLASGVVGSVDAALLTLYGRTLLLKIALAALAGGLGLLNAVRLHRRRPPAAPRRTVLAEAVVGVGVLLLAAVLTSGQPAQEPQLIRRAPVATVPIVDGQVADLQETLAVRPNRPGRNVALVSVFDTRRPAPAPVSSVEVSFLRADGSQIAAGPAERLTDGGWSVPVRLPEAGPARVRVTARRAGLPDAVLTYPWAVGQSPTPIRPAMVSNAPIAGLLRAASGGLAVVLLGVWVLVGWSWRRRRPAGVAGSLPVTPAPAVTSPRESALMR